MQVERKLAIEREAARALLLSIKEIVEDDEQARADAVEGETSLMEAIDKALERKTLVEAHIEGLKAAQQRLKDRKERFENQVERIRGVIAGAMEAIDVKRLERPTATLTLALPSPQVQITAESELPSAYLVEKVTVSPDKRKLLADLKAGATIPGAELKNGAPALQIRSI